MNASTQYLPDCSIEDVVDELSAIGFSSAQRVEKLNIGGGYNQIFRLTFDEKSYDRILRKAGPRRNSPSTTQTTVDRCFILRVAGSHVPKLKIENEVGILSLLSQQTAIPVPHVVHFDSTTANALHNEYIIMLCLAGKDGSDLYPSLNKSQLFHILDQLVSICLELYQLDFSHIGGLKPNIETIDGSVVSTDIQGPPIMETMWQLPDIERYFIDISLDNPALTSSTVRSTLESLNAISPNGYASYSAWLAAQMQVYIHAIQIHPSLSWVLELDPGLTALQTFTTKLTTDTDLCTKLNNVPLKLAHRDLHFGNMLLSPSPSDSPSNTPHHNISGILDWEFAAILPFPLWRHSFLWDGIRTVPSTYDGSESEFFAESRRTRNELYDIWTQKVVDKGGELGRRMLADVKWKCTEQEMAWDVVNYLRCVIEVCPRNVQAQDARRWWIEVVKALSAFGIYVEK